jgi:hypothetical protein
VPYSHVLPEDTCFGTHNVPYVTNVLDDDFVVTATDFPHEDAFRQGQLAQGLIKRGDLSDNLIEKILSENPGGRIVEEEVEWFCLPMFKSRR